MKYFTLFLLLIITYSCKAQVVVKANDPHIRYSGRIAFIDSAAVLSWSGSSVKVNFEGSVVKFDIRDEGDNYFTEIIDGKVVGIAHTQGNGKKEYAINNFVAGKHTLDLFKRTEWAMGKTFFYGFTIDGKVLPAPAEPKRKIEIFGNSISCG